MHRAVAAVIVLWAVAGTVAAQLPWKLPPPVLTRIDPPSAAPGATIDVYGKNLNPQAFVGPRVVFETRPTFMSQPARVISSTELRVVVPPGSGTTHVHVETAGGNSNAVTFTYETPTVVSLSPAYGGGGQVVTIVGHGFGVKQAFEATTFVKFGDSLAQPVQWDDQKIVVKAPTDFGTGTNTNILLGLLGCGAGQGTGTQTSKLILDLSLPGCTDLFTSLVQRYQLATNPGFLERQVQVVVRTAAGISNQRTFTYRVQAEISAILGSPNGQQTGLFPFCRASGNSVTWGDVGLTGRLAVPPTYRNAAPFSEGLGRVQFANGRWGFLDSNGNVAIPGRFSDEGDFHEAVARVMVAGGKSGFIDRSGAYAIAPTIGEGPHATAWWGVLDFSDGLAEISELNGRQGWIDKSGRVALSRPTEYGNYWVGAETDFSDGLVVVGFSPKRGGSGLFGYMNKAGRFVIPARYKIALHFSGGLAAVGLGGYPNGTMGYINQTGKVVIDFKFADAENFSEGLAAVELSGKYGYIDTSGKVVIEPKFDMAKTFSGGLAAVRVGGKWGFIDKLGNMRIAPQFKFAFTNYADFSQGLALVELSSGVYAYIDKKGRIVATTCALPTLPSS
jgi:WG containing repeat/IPT/TIG domain